MKVRAIIERGDDGTYGVYLEDNAANILIIGNGDSIAEAKEDFMLCRDEMKAYYEEEGREFPELEFEFQYDAASFLSYYNQFISLEGLEHLTGLKQISLNQYLNPENKPNIQTTKKIQQHLHSFGKELQQLKFA